MLSYFYFYNVLILVFFSVQSHGLTVLQSCSVNNRITFDERGLNGNTLLSNGSSVTIGFSGSNYKSSSFCWIFNATNGVYTVDFTTTAMKSNDYLIVFDNITATTEATYFAKGSQKPNPSSKSFNNPIFIQFYPTSSSTNNNGRSFSIKVSYSVIIGIVTTTSQTTLGLLSSTKTPSSPSTLTPTTTSTSITLSPSTSMPISNSSSTHTSITSNSSVTKTKHPNTSTMYPNTELIPSVEPTTTTLLNYSSTNSDFKSSQVSVATYVGIVFACLIFVAAILWGFWVQIKKWKNSSVIEKFRQEAFENIVPPALKSNPLFKLESPNSNSISVVTIENGHEKKDSASSSTKSDNIAIHAQQLVEITCTTEVKITSILTGVQNVSKTPNSDVQNDSKTPNSNSDSNTENSLLYKTHELMLPVGRARSSLNQSIAPDLPPRLKSKTRSVLCNSENAEHLV